MDSPQEIQEREVKRTLEVPSKFLAGPDANRTTPFYNEKSGLIVLDGPNGPMLARYMGKETPDPQRFVFLTMYSMDHNTFNGMSVPDVAPADVTAYAFPVEKSADPRLNVVSGASGEALNNTGERGPRRMITAESGERQDVTEMTGIEVKPGEMSMYGGGGAGMKLTGSGAHFTGGFEQPSTQKKGLTVESVLFGLVPKTVITFFASDYLPNIGIVLRLAKWVNIIRRMPKLFTSIKRIANDLGGDIPDDPRGVATEVGMPEDTDRSDSPEEAGEELSDDITDGSITDGG